MSDRESDFEAYGIDQLIAEEEEPDEEHQVITELLDSCLGKTIATWSFIDRPYGDGLPWPGEGITLTFTDGSTLELHEHRQAGEIRYSGG